MYPSGVRFLALGVGLERMTPEGYDHVVDRIVPAAEKLAAQGANAICVMGTSLTFYKGAASNEQLKVRVTKSTGLPSTTMSTAIVEGLKAVGARRVAAATAYNNEVNARLKSFLDKSGSEVLALKGMGIERFEDRPPVTQEELITFSAGVRIRRQSGYPADLLRCVEDTANPCAAGKALQSASGIEHAACALGGRSSAGPQWAGAGVWKSSVTNVIPNTRPRRRGSSRRSRQVSLPGTACCAPTKAQAQPGDWRSRNGNHLGQRVVDIASARSTPGQARAANGGSKLPHSTRSLFSGSYFISG